jgi:hypothetical protein
MFDYSNEIDSGSKVWLHEKELKRIHRGIFAHNAVVKSWGCHTGESMSKFWRQATGKRMIGAIGKTDYAKCPTNGWIPQLSPGARWGGKRRSGVTASRVDCFPNVSAGNDNVRAELETRGKPRARCCANRRRGDQDVGLMATYYHRRSWLSIWPCFGADLPHVSIIAVEDRYLAINLHCKTGSL